MTPTQAGPTPSPTSNQLIAVAQAVVAGTAPRAALQAAASHQSGELARTRRDFARRAGQMPGTPGLQGAIAEVYAGFGDYQASLDALGNATSEAEAGAAIALLTAATMRLVSALAACDVQELAAEGPTSSPYVNLMMRLVSQLEAGQMTPEAYRAAVEQAFSSTAQGYTPLLQQLEGEASADGEPLRRAHEQHEAAVRIFVDYASQRDGSVLEEAARRLEQAITRLDEALRDFGMARLSRGPSRSSHVNLLRNVLDGFAKGALPLSSLRNAAAGFENVLRETRGDVEQVAGLATTPALEEELARLRSALGEAAAFHAEVAACGTPEGAALLLQRFEGFSGAVDHLIDAFEVVREVGEQAGKVVCVHCGHRSARDAATCENCHAHLPRFESRTSPSSLGMKEGGSPAGDMPVPKPLGVLLEAANRVAEDPEASEAFLLAVDEAERAVERNEREVTSLAERRKATAGGLEEEGEKVAVTAALDRALVLVHDGTSAIRVGLKRMREFVHDRNRGVLEEAIRQVYQGFHQLWEVHRASRGAVLDSDVPRVFQEEPQVSVVATASSLALSAETAEVEDPDDAGASAFLRGFLEERE